jgi:hypothetical protein
MRTILIAHRDVVFAEQLAHELRTGGYRVIVCPGPQPPQRCIRCEKGYCPLTEGADVMIYDPRLTSTDAEKQDHNLAVDAALAHPEVPLLLVWSRSTVPDVGTLRAIRSQVPWVQIAEHAPNGLLRQIHELLLATPVPIPMRNAP